MTEQCLQVVGSFSTFLTTLKLVKTIMYRLAFLRLNVLILWPNKDQEFFLLLIWHTILVDISFVLVSFWYHIQCILSDTSDGVFPSVQIVPKELKPILFQSKCFGLFITAMAKLKQLFLACKMIQSSSTITKTCEFGRVMWYEMNNIALVWGLPSLKTTVLIVLSSFYFSR